MRQKWTKRRRRGANPGVFSPWEQGAVLLCLQMTLLYSRSGSRAHGPQACPSYVNQHLVCGKRRLLGMNAGGLKTSSQCSLPLLTGSRFFFFLNHTLAFPSWCRVSSLSKCVRSILPLLLSSICFHFCTSTIHYISVGEGVLFPFLNWGSGCLCVYVCALMRHI